MQINRNNYEVYIVDYFDGQLSPDLVAELMWFLEQHPDLREDFETYCTEPLCSNDECFIEKEMLKRRINPFKNRINEDNYQDYIFKEIEGELNASESADLESFVKLNPVVEREFRLMQMTRLPIENIPFPDKKLLKRTQNVQLRWIAAAAAVILLLIVSGLTLLLIPSNTTSDSHRLSGINKPNIPDRNIPNTEFLQDNGHPGQTGNPNLTAINNDELLSPPKNTSQQSEVIRQSVPLIPLQGQLAFIPDPMTISQVPAEAYLNTYTDIMQYYALRMERQLAQKKDEEEKSILQKGMDVVYKANGTEDQNRKKISFWDIAEIGVAGYNAVARNDVELKRKTDADGRTQSFALGKLEYSRNK